MFKQGIKDVEFVVCNTDQQALEASPVPNKIRIGENSGLGAGSKPIVGEEAAKASIEKLKEAFPENIKMVFITAGMGGGTGTGAAPIIAQIAQEMGILTVGIVTLPFSWEGRRRKKQAEAGIENLRQLVDTLLVINNDKLREQYGNLRVGEAFAKADNVLSTSAKGIAEIITVSAVVNTDFEDVKTVIQGSGKAIMGTGVAEGENRAMTAVEEAMNSPLLNDNDIKGAQNILLQIVTGTDEITMDEISEITEYVQSESGNEADLIWGLGHDDELKNNIRITLIATGFDSKNKQPEEKKPAITHVLGEEKTQVPTNKKKEVIADKPKLVEDKIEEKTEEKPPKEFTRITKREKEETPGATDDISQTHISFIKKSETTTFSSPEESKPKAPENNTGSDEKEDLPRKEEEKSHPKSFEKFTKHKTPDQSHLSIQRTVNEFGVEIREESKRLNNDDDKMEKNSRERINKLKNLSKMHNSGEISQLEKTPAFRRKNIDIDNTPPSTQSPISRFTLGKDSKDNPVIKSDNSFLHDNVD
jgi:cell division protein FtsZ